ncbi:uncharacterized protein PgNI_09161 [Pyricularia grisea]|uniref:Uncharacterized protein n=1 Tax=Pyricularia grisea TaxID=148305 RepID=A0A6P8ARE4_PYRGI|nr:uncharacterized protein PgNI_09161 [Pyricularia grisea]TLD04701.1 hypothetical protein PgNI_09161 [Pyricularia grisea]
MTSGDIFSGFTVNVVVVAVVDFGFVVLPPPPMTPDIFVPDVTGNAGADTALRIPGFTLAPPRVFRPLGTVAITVVPPPRGLPPVTTRVPPFFGCAARTWRASNPPESSPASSDLAVAAWSFCPSITGTGSDTEIGSAVLLSRGMTARGTSTDPGRTIGPASVVLAATRPSKTALRYGIAGV